MSRTSLALRLQSWGAPCSLAAVAALAGLSWTGATAPSQKAVPSGGKGSLTVSAPTSFDAAFRKGHVFAVSSDGGTVSGRGVTDTGVFPWSWTAKGGFVMGAKKAPDGYYQENPKAPKAKLDAWTKAHGWQATFPGKALGKRKAFYAFATGRSLDGTVVVGSYGSESEDQKIGEYQFDAIGGKDVTVDIRTFVWVKGKGFADLCDLAEPVRSIKPTGETESISAAVSPDGKTIAVLTDKFAILRAKNGFGPLTKK